MLKTILTIIREIIFTVLTLGLKDKYDKIQLEKDKESLIVGVNGIIGEGYYVYNRLKDGIDAEDFREFANPEHLKNMLNKVQKTYSTADRIKSTIKKLVKDKKMTKVG